MDHEPGIYEVTSQVTIRRQPVITEYTDPKTHKYVTNQVGSLNVGTKRAIYSVQVQKDNSVWGRVSEADSAGIAQWVCIENINRIFMKFVEPLVKPSDGFERLEAELEALKLRVEALEKGKAS